MVFLPEVARRAESIELTHEEIKRYSRHLIMPEVTMEGQKRLKAGRVLVVGTGGLGSPLLAYLAAAGVGRVGIMDFDNVDVTNLHRQIIHKSNNVGKPKVQSALETLREINPLPEYVIHETSLRSDNAQEICAPYDIIVDGTDNFATRYLVNDVCVLQGKPNVHGSIFRFDGQVTVFWKGHGPCYRCLYPEPPEPGSVPSCAEGGVLGVLPGVVGTLQATEVIKLLIGVGRPLIGRLMLFDALAMKAREIKIRRDPHCPICGEQPTITELVDTNVFCGTPPVDAPARRMLAIPEIAPAELKRRLDQGARGLVLLDVREPHEWDICHIPGATLIPVGQLTARIHELDSADEIVIYCKGFQRTETAFRTLQQAGFRKLLALEGGIEGWAEDVDPSMPTY